MISSSRKRLFLFLSLGLITAGISVVFATRRPAAPTLQLVDATNAQLRAKYETGAGLCPWRNPDADLKQFFPLSTSHRESRLSVSGKQVELAKRLGRKPTGEENVQPVFHIFRGEQLLGSVTTRRVRGENGAIEMVLATDTKHNPIGLKIQRHREMEDLKKKFERLDFVQSCTIDSLASECCGTGNEAVVREGVKTLRILLEEGDVSGH